MIFFPDDVVYNQSAGGNSTMDKRRPDLRDELGYIAPPNRKLPPVPGSNYNTCDRIKRGTAISKDVLTIYCVCMGPSMFCCTLFWMVLNSKFSTIRNAWPFYSKCHPPA